MENDDIVERVKAASPIELIMEEAGVQLVGHGRYRRDKAHDSLVVDLHEQYYVHNSTGERGDVIAWLEHEKKWDFKRTVEFLCQRAGMEAPTWGNQNPAVAAATRAREEALDVAAGVFSSWLWRMGTAPGTPLAYARSRGWSDETIKAAGLGYTGDWNAPGYKDLLEEMKAALKNASPSLAAVTAITGYQGDVSKIGIEVRADWVDDKRIPSFCGRNMIVYPHRRGGRVKYLSGRNITQKTHYNLPSELVGSRQPYFNHCYSSKAEICVIVEGQADAISLAQWEIAAVALSGTAADNSLLMALKGHQRLYVGLDDDKAGKMTSLPIMEVLGPMVRLVHWRKLIAGLTQGRKGTPVKKRSVPAPSLPRGQDGAGSQPDSHESSFEGSDGVSTKPMNKPRASEPLVDMGSLTDEELAKMAEVKDAWEKQE